MAFLKLSPYNKSEILDITTTTRLEIQLWQEFQMLRHIKGSKSTYGKSITAPYIDQAKIYFKDAYNSNWKSSGLLYYYSFLNLAKAFIISKRAISATKLKSTSIYHGLSVKPQVISNITNYKIEIHPPTSNGKNNVFGKFYERLTENKWPFSQNITISMGEILPYCYDIMHELNSFYSIVNRVISFYTLYRFNNNQVWFEFFVPHHETANITQILPQGSFILLSPHQLSIEDKRDWLDAYDLTAEQIINYSLIRMTPLNYNNQNQAIQTEIAIKNSHKLFSNYLIPRPDSTLHSGCWDFVKKIITNNQSFYWHPLLSNYIVSFALSNILRYQPHILKEKDAFIAEAWCNQSAITSLRYFLMEYTNPSLRFS